MLEKMQKREERDHRKKEREGDDEKDKFRLPKMPFSRKGNEKLLPTARD